MGTSRRYTGLVRRAFVLVLLALSGCTSSPSEPEADRAVLTVTQAGAAQVCFSPSGTANYRLRVPLLITESAGLGARVEYVRLALFDAAGAEVERQQVGAPAVAAFFGGTDRIEAQATLRGTVGIDFNSATFTAQRLEVGFVDDRGHAITQVLNGIQGAPSQTCTI